MAIAEGILQDEAEATPTERSSQLIDLSLQVRLMLGRRLILALIAPPSGADEAFINLAARLSTYPEVTSLTLTPRSTKTEEAERMVDEATRVDADAVLVALASGSPTTQLVDSASVPSLKWPRDVLRAAERSSLRQRAFLGMIGEGVNRDAAQRLGFEDGFAIAISAHDLVAYLAQDALRREQCRRAGGPTPCDK